MEPSTRKPARIPLRAVNAPEFLHELHHFLWTEPQYTAGRVDAGWNCRDHALVLGLLLTSCGYKAALASGEATFVRGAKGATAATSFFQRPHSWLVADGVGAIDLSIKPDFACGTDRYRLPITSVFAGAWHPRGRGQVYVVADAGTYAEVAQALLRTRNHASAVYMIRECEQLHAGHVTRSAGWNGSLLTTLLDRTWGDPSGAYAALVLHLRDLLLGRAPRLAGRPFPAAWEQVLRAREGAVECVLASVAPHLPRVPAVD